MDPTVRNVWACFSRSQPSPSSRPSTTPITSSMTGAARLWSCFGLRNHGFRA